ncbi:MAG: FAD-dependent oxidoreductase, partial [Phormidesmis sp.]
AHCSHYGAPLAKGVMQGDRIVCPWHNACFEAATGKQVEPPGRNNLAQYAVQIDSGTVYIEQPVPESEHPLPEMAKPDPQQTDQTFVIVGGGAAGCAAAEMLRQVNFQGRIIMLTADSELPYDRTKLSKAALQSDQFEGPDLLRPASFYEQYGIEVKTAAKVSQLDVEMQQLTYGGDETLSYDMLLLATGGKVRKIPVDGADRANVFTLRQAEDTQKILQAAQNAQRAVIIGAGFIGMEVAASLKQQGLDVTVVAPGEVPFEKVLGRSVGKMFQQVHEAKGVQFKLGCKAEAFKGEGSVEAVELDSGETVPADMVVVGIGVQPATDFVEGIALSERDRSIPVDQYLQAAPNVYAAGDIAQFPHFMTGDPVRIEHWRLAMQHGRIAACNMAGQAIPFEAVPFFWTGQFDLKLRYVGHAEDFDDVLIQGSLEEKSFLAFYVQAEQVLAVSGIGRDQDIAAISELMRLRQMPTVEKIKTSDIIWLNQLQEVS